jgi:hypothetical protein
MKRVRKTLKKYLVPHEENDHKPHLLRAKSVAFVLVVAVVMESVFLFGTSYLAPNSRLFGIILTNALVDGTNASRSSNNVAPLTISPLLQVAAQDKANDMVANNYFAHTSPAGVTPWDWFEKVDYNFIYAGENLAVNFSDSQDVTNAWMNSPEHRANILNTNFTQIGMATATGTYEGHPAVYVVELFGTPVPPPPPAEALIPFVNTAAAAAPDSQVSANVPAKSTAKTTTTKQILVATSALPVASSVQAFTTVKGASSSASTTALAPSAPATAGTVLPGSQNNPLQNAAANPRQVLDYIYLAIIALFALALGINLFVKIRIQHPQIIFGGMLVILVAGMLIVFNQHLMLAGAAIL